MNNNKGILYVVATPIGNLDDITYRAVHVLKDVDLIAAEDTRNTLKLLNRYLIKKKLMSYHKWNEKKSARKMIDILNEGKSIAIVTDSGTPGISDPGDCIIEESFKNDIKVVPIPGAAALSTALSVSGIKKGPMCFLGFLPRKPGQRRKIFNELRLKNTTFILYESPKRVLRLLEELRDLFGAIEIVICRELTKIHEEIIKNDINTVIEHFKQCIPRGEFTIVFSVQKN